MNQNLRICQIGVHLNKRTSINAPCSSVKREALNAYRQLRIFSSATKLQPDQHKGYVRTADAPRKCASFCERKDFFAGMGRVMRDAVDSGIGNDFADSEKIVHSRFVLHTAFRG